MATNADADALYARLTGLAGRPLTWKEIGEAFGLSKAQFYAARNTGGLVKRVDRLITAAQLLGINPVELMIAVVPGVEESDAVEFVEKRRREAARFLGAAEIQVDDVSDFISEVGGSPGSEKRLQQRGKRA